jgi:hypothetical protein
VPNTSLTRAKILDEVTTMLGGSTVDVELIEKDVEKCVRDALRQYNHNLPMRSRKAIPVTATQKRYVIAHPGLEGVTEVEFVDASQVNAGTIDPFTVIGQNAAQSMLAAPGTTYGAVEQMLAASEDYRKIASAEPEWYGQWEFTNPAGEYALYIDLPSSGTFYVAYTYAWHISPDENPGTGLQIVPNEDVDWVLEYVLCRAKQILGRKRGKFQGITNPDGGSDPTDSNELIAEGREDQVRLEEVMLKRRRPLLPVVD